MKFIFLFFFLIISTNIPAQSLAEGEKIYVNYCQTCHQANGKGVHNLNPPLDNSATILAKNSKKLIRFILEGSPNEKLPIQGKFYANTMPAQKDILTNEEIASVILFMQQSWTNKNKKTFPVTTQQIENIRLKIGN